MEDHILIRYGELALKKSNRKQFINRINNSIKRALSGYDKLNYDARGLRFYIILNGENSAPIIEKLKKIPGIYSFSVVSRCESNIESIAALATILLNEEFKNGMKTIKVDTNRGDKHFPMTSLEITKEVSRHLFRNIQGLKADVHNPELTLHLDVRYEGTFIFTNIIMGMGGMPAGSIGKVMLMVSGGIDSVVAGYLTIKKGMSIEAVHFAAPPYTSDLAVQKVIDLLEKLSPYTEYQNINLHIVPFTEIQKSIYDYCREDYCITIMRRMMYRITTMLSEKHKCIAIVNGESIGQVASQTLESISTIGEVTSMPVIRPLATFDKSEIIKIATSIDTYDISIRPYEDCCTVFVPKHPQIKPLNTKAREEELKFDFEPMIEKAVNETNTLVIKSSKHLSIFENNDEDIF
jgi:thiamine biosynthesis protein ThiI